VLWGWGGGGGSVSLSNTGVALTIESKVQNENGGWIGSIRQFGFLKSLPSFLFQVHGMQSRNAQYFLLHQGLLTISQQTLIGGR